MKIRVFAFAFICLLSCNDETGNRESEYSLLQERLNRVEAKMDSLISVTKEREPLKRTTSKNEKKAKKKSKVTNNYLPATPKNNSSEQTWKSVNT